MEGTAEKTPKNRKTIWVAGGLVVALAVIVYFSFFYPPVANDEGQGTIGAAKKYHSAQITDKDVQFASVEKADEATIKEMENVADQLGQAAIAMKEGAVAVKFADFAVKTQDAIAQAATLGKNGYLAKDQALAVLALAKNYYAGLAALDVKGAAEAKFIALTPMAKNTEVAAHMAIIYASAQSWAANKVMEASAAHNLALAPSAYFAATSQGEALSSQASTDLLALTAPLAQAAIAGKAGATIDQKSIGDMAAKLELGLKSGMPLAGKFLEDKALLDQKVLEKNAIDAKAGGE